MDRAQAEDIVSNGVTPLQGRLAESDYQVGADEARRVLLADRERRERECREGLEALLRTHRCRINLVQVWVNGAPAGPAEIQVVAVEG